MKNRRAYLVSIAGIVLGCPVPADEDDGRTTAMTTTTTMPAESGGTDEGTDDADTGGESSAGESSGIGESGADTTTGDTGEPWPDALPIDCAIDTEAPECARPGWLEPGTIGEGPHFAQGGFPILRAGFTDGERVVFGTHFGSDSVHPSGVVASVDLRTGARAFVSGRYFDDYVTGAGEHEIGDGPDIDYINDVKPGPDGWYAVGEHAEAGKATIVVRIDPSTGDRELVFEEGVHPCDDGAGNPFIPSSWTIVVLPDGRPALNVTDNPIATGDGLVAVSPSGCEIVSLVGGTQADVGSGATIGDDFFGMVSRDGRAYGIEWVSSTLTEIDLATGDRRTISSTGAMMVGLGPELANESLVHAGDTIYTYAGYLSAVDPRTGDRTSIEFDKGPLWFAQIDGEVLLHPKTGWLVVLSELAVTVVDVDSGKSNIVSY
ncbi:MAG TPA: hypothetical protein VG755_45760 [Nannocystaceae bacterium]|nr:hypothetical protein [Nannocystaceae bacterium]